MRIILVILMSIISFTGFAQTNKKRTLVYFEKHLKADMSYTKILNTFGEPDRDNGSGIHIPVYDLNDGTSVVIGCVDKVYYARQINKDNEIIKILIGEAPKKLSEKEKKETLEYKMKRTLAYFKEYLRKDMTYSEITDTFGEPDSAFGSGIARLIYKLTDGSTILITYTGSLHAVHTSGSAQTVLIE